jgi:hypothetical protein
LVCKRQSPCLNRSCSLAAVVIAAAPGYIYMNEDPLADASNLISQNRITHQEKASEGWIKEVVWVEFPATCAVKR